MITRSGTFPSGSTTLSPEILLKIFLYLDCQTIIRSVCKEFLEIIDNNKSLWRTLDWIQEKDGLALPALEMFDEKSASTLKEVSILQGKGDVDMKRILQVLDRSKNTLTNLSLKRYPFELNYRLKLIELVSNCRHLESLVLWYSNENSLSRLPKTRLTRSSRQPYLDTERSSNLQVLWCFNLVGDWNGKLDVSSLVSFADTIQCGSLQLRSILSNFSTTLVHLSINSVNDITTPSLSCPSLRILEGRFYYGFPSWIDAPNLQIVIASSVGETFVPVLPVSVQELWLLYPRYSSGPAKVWDFLPLVCPELKVLKLGREYFEGNSDSEDLSVALRSRQDKVQEGVEIKGIKMVSLEKVIVPTDVFASFQLDDLREIVGEVIDMEDYPDFIELEY